MKDIKKFKASIISLLYNIRKYLQLVMKEPLNLRYYFLTPATVMMMKMVVPHQLQ